jgi:cardiolipin synthase
VRRLGDCKNVGRFAPASRFWSGPQDAASQVVHVTIPNFITIARLIAVPLIVWLMIADRFVEATALFVLAGLSDAADGFIAKRFGAASELGAYLDPIVDKALLVSVFVTLGFKDALPPWLIILVVSRDLFIIGGMLLAYILSNPMPVRPLLVSKVNTAAQIILIAFVLGDRSGAMALVWPIRITVLGVAALTIVSAGAYLVEWVRHMAGGPVKARGGIK